MILLCVDDSITLVWYCQCCVLKIRYHRCDNFLYFFSCVQTRIFFWMGAPYSAAACPARRWKLIVADLPLFLDRMILFKMVSCFSVCLPWQRLQLLLSKASDVVHKTGGRGPQYAEVPCPNVFLRSRKTLFFVHSVIYCVPADVANDAFPFVLSLLSFGSVAFSSEHMFSHFPVFFPTCFLFSLEFFSECHVL